MKLLFTKFSIEILPNGIKITDIVIFEGAYYLPGIILWQEYSGKQTEKVQIYFYDTCSYGDQEKEKEQISV